MADKQRIQEIMSCEGHILEMVSDTSLDVPVDPRIDINVLIADDPDPKFANVEIIRTGISKTNNRRYGSSVVKEINDIVPGVQGFLGHPDPSKYGFEFREPQCIYVGSMVQEMQGGTRSVAKAYLFKTSPLREWVPKSIGAKNPMTVSINGIGDVIKNGDILDVIHISELQSIDWANPGTEGMDTSQAISVVNEMQNNKGGSETMEGVKDILKNATVTEFRAYNPDGYKNLVGGISVTELQAMNPDLVNQIQESGKITEMQLTVGGEKKTIKIAELQGVIGGIEATITELKGKIDDLTITEFRNRKINELVPESMRAAITKRVVGKTEAEIEASINSEIAYVREMGGSIDNPPAGRSGGHSGDDIIKGIQNLFGVKDQFVKK